MASGGLKAGFVYRYQARDLHLVMGPAAPGTDVDEQGNGTVAEQRLYQLMSQPGAVIERQ